MDIQKVSNRNDSKKKFESIGLGFFSLNKSLNKEKNNEYFANCPIGYAIL
ncbi:hypothetical protein HMPREF1987_02028 [Peptostreptococcaceae bacterium oral taxon 113 str. W5053]|nr:hypothetical protein HMPREF1987_02028 [Peptostreptococcaceae bacterium oral taxon 113 str. W5053]